MLLEGEVIRDHKTGSRGKVTLNLGTCRTRKGVMCQKVRVRIFEAKAYHKVGDPLIWLIPLEEEES